MGAGALCGSVCCIDPLPDQWDSPFFVPRDVFVGANVRKGEKGTTVIFARPLRDDEEDKAHVVARVFTVFNVASFENLPKLPAFEEKTVETTHADARALLAQQA